MPMIDRRTAILAAAALALAAAPAAGQQVDAARWGFYARLAGGSWTGRLSSGQVELTRYTWIRRGETLRAEHRILGGQNMATETITLGDKPGELLVTTEENGRAEPTRSVVTLNPDGSAVETFVGRTGAQERAIYRVVDPDHYRVSNERLDGGQWRVLWLIDVMRDAAS